VQVVRDILDKLVVDRNGREIGRVDGIELELTPGRPPRLGAVLIGPIVLGYRLHPALGRLAAAIERALALGPGRPVRVPFDDVNVGTHVKIGLAAGETAAEAFEQRLRKWVQRIPGSR
jgi:sporulation protein YlmC with PRC-barrel domain